MTPPEPSGVARVQGPLGDARREVEDALAGLRASLPQAVAGPSTRKPWLLPLLAAAVGVALAVTVRRRRPRPSKRR